jgi:hypothetical protein
MQEYLGGAHVAEVEKQQVCWGQAARGAFVQQLAQAPHYPVTRGVLAS